jgi:putative transcriptional regulator
MHTLKSLRGLKDMTQEEAAIAIGVSVDTWRNWELKKTYPNVPQIIKIEEVFQVRYSNIIFLS